MGKVETCRLDSPSSTAWVLVMILLFQKGECVPATVGSHLDSMVRHTPGNCRSSSAQSSNSGLKRKIKDFILAMKD